jgi:hypothetical protein
VPQLIFENGIEKEAGDDGKKRHITHSFLEQQDVRHRNRAPITHTPNWVHLAVAGWNVHVESNNRIVGDFEGVVACFKNVLR